MRARNIGLIFSIGLCSAIGNLSANICEPSAVVNLECGEMLVRLRRSPNILGVSFGAEVCTEKLEPSEAKMLLRLLETAAPEFRLLHHSTEVASDTREVTITVEKPKSILSIVFSEDNPHSSIQPLLEFLSKYERVIPER